MFFWFEVADILSDIKADITKQERINILNSLRCTLVPMLYVQALKEKYGQNILFPDTLPSSPDDLSHISFINKCHLSPFADELFPLLPYLQTLTLIGVALSQESTQALINNAELDLSDRNEDALVCLDCFSSEYIRSLDVSSCGICSSDVISGYICIFDNLQELCVFGNHIELAELCEKAKTYRSKPLLYSLHSTQELGFLKCGYLLPFKEIQIYFSDNDPFNQLYKTVYGKRKDGFNISVWNPSALIIM